MIFTDEWGGGMRPRCRAYDPLTWGADAIYDIVDGTRLEYRAHYKMPAPQLEEENCVAHNGSIIPVPGRDIFVQAWYQGGLSVVDFTDSANPVEIAYFDRGPLDEEELVLAGYWSTYWYDGRIYGTEIVRGLDVFELVPSEYLSAGEIAAAALAESGPSCSTRNSSLRLTWPAEPVVARAYLDQLGRAEALPGQLATDLAEALERAEERLADGSADPAPRRPARVPCGIRDRRGSRRRTGAQAERGPRREPRRHRDPATLRSAADRLPVDRRRPRERPGSGAVQRPAASSTISGRIIGESPLARRVDSGSRPIAAP